MKTRLDIVNDGKNLTIAFTGIVQEEIDWHELVDLSKFRNVLTGVRVDSVLWLIQEKMGLLLWWDRDQLVMPMESRNFVRFDNGIQSPRDTWSKKLYLSSFKQSDGPVPKHFFLLLDLEKQS